MNPTQAGFHGPLRVLHDGQWTGVKEPPTRFSRALARWREFSPRGTIGAVPPWFQRPCLLQGTKLRR